jgi:predicted nucleotidyltransferase
VDRERIIAFCRKWRIVELALFGSVLRDDFRKDSDVDVLVTFGPGGRLTFENRVKMLDELSAIFGRSADLVEKRAIRNPFRRYEILTTKSVVYAA